MKLKTDVQSTLDSKMTNNSTKKNYTQDPVGQLTAIFGKIYWNTVLLAGVHNKCCFEVSTVINGKTFQATGTTLKMAKKLCALAALMQISGDKPISNNWKKITGLKASARRINGIPVNEEIVQKYSKNKTDRRLQPLQSITNLQLSSKHKTEKKISNLKTIKDNSIHTNLTNQCICKTPNPVADLIDNGSIVLSDDIKSIAFSEQSKENSYVALEQSELLLNRVEKVCSDSPIKNTQPILIEKNDSDCITPEQNDVINLPCSSLNIFENNSKHKNSGLQSNCSDSSDGKTLISKINSLELSSVLRNNLNILNSTTQNNSNLDIINVQTIEMNVSIKNFTKNSIVDASLFPNQVKNAKINLKRPREESIELDEMPPYKIQATDEDNVLSKQRQKCQQGDALTDLRELRPNFNFNISQIKESNNELCSSLLLPSKYADIIESKIMRAFDNFTCGYKEVSRYKVLAGFIMTCNMDFKNSNVVSIATGTKCIHGGNICCNGSVLNDSHAEIIAKRGLKKFLFTQLRHHFRSDTMESSVFERTAMGYKLKPFVHFHLYINTAPCGDARVFNFNHKNRTNNIYETSFNSLQYGQLRTKVEGNLGTKPIGSRFYHQTWDGIVLGEPLHTMSCSDKIALWNVVGIQGALLSQFIEPIYLHSITLGSLFDAQHLYRAVCGRIQDTIGHLPQSYYLNRPLLGQTSRQLRRYVFNAPSIGINWTWGDSDIEIISLPTGRGVDNKTSFLSKQAFFYKYFCLCNNLPNVGRNNGSNIYAEAKQNAKDYQNAKRAAFEAFYRANLGNWVKKPNEQNEFAMNMN